MDCLSIISDSAYRAETIGNQLHGVFQTELIPLDSIPDSPPPQFTICDVNLDSPLIPALKMAAAAAEKWKDHPRRRQRIALSSRAGFFSRRHGSDAAPA
jgi:hypothetical protein